MVDVVYVLSNGNWNSGTTPRDQTLKNNLQIVCNTVLEEEQSS